jgi:hypothetical protein
MKRILWVAAFGLLSAGALSACGSSSGGSSGSGVSHAKSSTGGSALVAYRHTLESANSILAGHTGFDSCGVQYNATACLRWARADVPVEKQALAKLDSVKPPAQFSADNSQIISLIRRAEHDDAMLARATEHAKSQNAPSALELKATADFDSLVTNRLLPLMHRVDPSISASLS